MNTRECQVVKVAAGAIVTIVHQQKDEGELPNSIISGVHGRRFIYFSAESAGYQTWWVRWLQLVGHYDGLLVADFP